MSVTETIPLPKETNQRRQVLVGTSTSEYSFIKKLIRAYFLLLLFEGVLNSKPKLSARMLPLVQSAVYQRLVVQLRKGNISRANTAHDVRGRPWESRHR